MKVPFVLLSSLLVIVASQGPSPFPTEDRQDPFFHGPMPFYMGKGFIEDMIFGTSAKPKTFDCEVKGCKWSDHEVHKDWMVYGAGIGNPMAMNPIICAQRCALDINCGAFEYGTSKDGTNYCSWWRVGVCEDGDENFQTCLKKDTCIPYSESACRNAALMAELKLGGAGYDFASDSDEYEKGCYTYDDVTDLGDFRGRVYYGRGGTEEEMAKPLDGGKIRLDGADCRVGSICKCIGTPAGEVDANDEITVNITGTDYKYPSHYGSECAKHDEGMTPDCDTDDPPAWCFDSWCFVDQVPCEDKEGNDLGAKPSGYVPGQSYSYAICGSTDNYPATAASYGMGYAR